MHTFFSANDYVHYILKTYMMELHQGERLIFFCSNSMLWPVVSFTSACVVGISDVYIMLNIIEDRTAPFGTPVLNWLLLMFCF